jgi:protein phosphatase
MRYIWATGTDQGRVRERNEDSLFPQHAGSAEGPILVAVADGMGGHVAGNIASNLAMETVTASAVDDGLPVEERVLAANDAIIESVTQDPALAGMGTTMTLGTFASDGTLRMAHVGDSRGYLLRDDELRQLTDDHTVVAELVELGRLSSEAADNHPQRHLLTRSLGLGPVEVDDFSVGLEAGDRVLFCSDGLTTMLSDDEILEILRADKSVESIVWDLIEGANSAGGLDNITVAVIDAR